MKPILCGLFLFKDLLAHFQLVCFDEICTVIAVSLSVTSKSTDQQKIDRSKEALMLNPKFTSSNTDEECNCPSLRATFTV